jgi:hypothetical protein
MPRNEPIGRAESIGLEEALERRLERRLRRIDRALPAVEETSPFEPDPGASLQALSEKVTRLRLHAALLAHRASP